MAGGRFELAMEPTAIGLVSLNSNSETHIAICDARLIYGRGWISRVFICCATLSRPSSGRVNTHPHLHTRTHPYTHAYTATHPHTPPLPTTTTTPTPTHTPTHTPAPPPNNILSHFKGNSKIGAQEVYTNVRLKQRGKRIHPNEKCSFKAAVAASLWTTKTPLRDPYGHLEWLYGHLVRAEWGGGDRAARYPAPSHLFYSLFLFWVWGFITHLPALPPFILSD